MEALHHDNSAGKTQLHILEPQGTSFLKLGPATSHC